MPPKSYHRMVDYRHDDEQSVNVMQDLLTQAGFKVKGRRAKCAHCSGTSRLTVSFTDEVAYCHRCHWTANATQMARSQGRTVTRKIGLARHRKRQFEQWVSSTYGEMARVEWELSRKASLAIKVLIRFPDCEPAWTALASWYHAEYKLAVFFNQWETN